MKANGSPPTALEWASSDVQVTLIRESGIVGLTKRIERENAAYSQTIWLTLTQLRALASDLT